MRIAPTRRPTTNPTIRPVLLDTPPPLLFGFELLGEDPINNGGKKERPLMLTEVVVRLGTSVGLDRTDETACMMSSAAVPTWNSAVRLAKQKNKCNVYE